MLVTVKNIKTCKWSGMEGDAVTCTIYIDGKRAGTATDDGNGGGFRYDFKDRELEQAFYAFVKQQETQCLLCKYSKGDVCESCGGTGKRHMGGDPDIYIADLIDKADLIKIATKNWKKGYRYTLFKDTQVTGFLHKVDADKKLAEGWELVVI